MNNIKVGIITFHNTSNYGAALQTFATLSLLKQLGFKAEIIDYSNIKRDRIYSPLYRFLSLIKQKQFIKAVATLLAFPGIIKRNREFLKFYKKNLKTSHIKYFNCDKLKNNDFNYDVVIAGSDQIWNYNHNGNDLNYLLNFIPYYVKKISYASSFGLSKIPNDLKSKYTKLLNRFDYISVREEMGVDIIYNLIGKPFLALDPVLTHNPSFWTEYMAKIKFKEKSFDLYYLNNNSFRTSSIFDTQNKNSNFKKICLGSFRFADIFDSNFFLRNHQGPNYFLSYIKNARIVYTSSFHAVCFCLIFNVPFYVFMSGIKGKDSRVKHLLAKFNLCNRIIEKDTGLINKNENIDFSNFNSQWPEWLKNSHEFILKSIFEDNI